MPHEELAIARAEQPLLSISDARYDIDETTLFSLLEAYGVGVDDYRSLGIFVTPLPPTIRGEYRWEGVVLDNAEEPIHYKPAIFIDDAQCSGGDIETVNHVMRHEIGHMVDDIRGPRRYDVSSTVIAERLRKRSRVTALFTGALAVASYAHVLNSPDAGLTADTLTYVGSMTGTVMSAMVFMTAKDIAYWIDRGECYARAFADRHSEVRIFSEAVTLEEVDPSAAE